MIHWQHNDGLCQLTGDLTKQSVGQLWQNRYQLLDNTSTLDLQNIKKVDSAGIAFLIALVAWGKTQEREIAFINPPTKLLTLAQVGDAIKVLRFVESPTST